MSECPCSKKYGPIMSLGDFKCPGCGRYANCVCKTLPPASPSREAMPDDAPLIVLLDRAMKENAALKAENEREKKSRESTIEFYTTRLERLKDFLKERGLWGKEAASIFANGTETLHENPTYAQRMNVLIHERDALAAQNEKLREAVARVTRETKHGPLLSDGAIVLCRQALTGGQSG